MVRTIIAFLAISAVFVGLGCLASVISWAVYLSACVFCLGGGFLVSTSVKRKLAGIPGWKKNLVLMSILFGAGLIWYTVFDLLARGAR